MPLKDDDTVCYCFHVSRRKIENFCRNQKPKVPSQISECLSAGTGCGWCVPLIKKLHAGICPVEQPWWRKPGLTGQPTSADIDDPAAYAAARQEYLNRKKDHGQP